MADRIPLIVNSTANQIQELPTGDHLQLNDSNKLKIGNSGDLEIFHSSSNSILNDTGTGNLLLQTGGSTIVEIKSTGVDITGILNASGIVNANDTTQSTNTTSGSLVVDGGVGIAKNLYVGGSTNIGSLIITDTTQSTNKDTGALIVEGGVGIEKNLSIGEQLNLTGTSAAGDSDINLSGGSDGLAVVTMTPNSGKLSFVTKNSSGTNSAVQLEHQKINFSGPDISGTAVTFEPKGAAPIFGVRAYGHITMKTTNGTYTADINGGNIASYTRLNRGEIRINFEHNMPNTNYVVMAMPEFGPGTNDGDNTGGTTEKGRGTHFRSEGKLVSSCRIVMTATSYDVDAVDHDFDVMVVG
tara:strand:+ start:38 stop:1102 length:1065 start_codon:yes stop_codon:yes gene_type:complete